MSKRVVSEERVKELERLVGELSQHIHGGWVTIPAGGMTAYKGLIGRVQELQNRLDSVAKASKGGQ